MGKYPKILYRKIQHDTTRYDSIQNNTIRGKTTAIWGEMDCIPDINVTRKQQRVHHQVH